MGTVRWRCRVHRAVVASGARFTGASIHFIDEAYDTGPILAQRVVRVLPTDTPEQVAARVLAEVSAYEPVRD
jgi:phosphoribosylglycinamide formyltransferase